MRNNRRWSYQAGLAAARTEVLALSVVVMPALAMETVCCSITSWMAVRSLSSILSNSSMQQMPMSASTCSGARKDSDRGRGGPILVGGGRKQEEQNKTRVSSPPQGKQGEAQQRVRQPSDMFGNLRTVTQPVVCFEMSPETQTFGNGMRKPKAVLMRCTSQARYTSNALKILDGGALQAPLLFSGTPTSSDQSTHLCNLRTRLTNFQRHLPHASSNVSPGSKDCGLPAPPPRAPSRW
jgi:hypothetical protein